MKNYILGWYDLQIDSYDPIDFVGNPQSFVLNGVADYKIDGSSNGELISLRLEQFGDDDGVDFYLVCIIIVIVIVIMIVIGVVSSWFHQICVLLTRLEFLLFSSRCVYFYFYVQIYSSSSYSDRDTIGRRVRMMVPP